MVVLEEVLIRGLIVIDPLLDFRCRALRHRRDRHADIEILAVRDVGNLHLPLAEGALAGYQARHRQRIFPLAADHLPINHRGLFDVANEGNPA